jgi:hypothetical protein
VHDADDKAWSRHYVLNESGQECADGTWID